MGNITALREEEPQLPAGAHSEQIYSGLSSTIEMLSFVKKTKSRWSYWSVDGSSLTYHQQNRLGASMAAEALAAVRETECTPLLGWIILDQFLAMKRRGKDLGVIVGFAEHICKAAAFRH